ncbi:Post-SET domain,Methyl-CpG DNA binding,Pre-SET domain,SET domain,DNA-binding domain [Cinara cedri]|uniref:Post-SET domain,Methyl-CpG DNA binding,Pre-SET domain,SET domain,DNA-binding domain n=1 Tax=Cinara cedri TaxID=506608 RepID=A0A5E4NNP5_9HEMI|nr:Post-SET domain,Methyl-CpG DNA binding,Pre-SET domain,SET domain,DNA-binding domain [Cinara cedri]
MDLSDESIEIVEIKSDRNHFRCINRHCTNGDDNLIKALDFVCNFYHVRYKPNKEVCSMCFKKCVNHFYKLRAKMDRGECLLQAEFPSYDSYVVIESSSSEDEDENEHKTQKNLRIPKEVLKLVPTDPDLLAFASLGFDYYFENKKEIIDKHIALCENETEVLLQNCIAQANLIDEQSNNLEKELDELRNAIYEPYVPTRVIIETVDLEELSNDNVQACVKKNCTSNINHNEENRMDGDVITLNSVIVCDIPDDLPNEGPLEYPTLQIGQHMFAKKFSLLDPWYKSKIQAIINNDYLHMKFSSDEKLLTTKEVAYFDPSPVRFPIGARVLAKYSETENQILSNYYAGVIAEPPKLLNKFRYMVFFDNGNVRYRHHNDIRLIVHKSKNVSNDVQDNCQEFLRSYLEKYPERQMVRLNKNHFVRAEFDQRWMVAKVTEVDASMVKLYFMDLQKSEWLYRGSSRLWNIFEKQSKSEKGIRLRQSGLAYLKKPFVEYSNVDNSERVKSTESAESVGSAETVDEKTNIVESVENEIIDAVLSHKSVARKSTSKNATEQSSSTVISSKHNNITFKTVPLIIPITAPRSRKMKIHTCDHSCIAWTRYDYNDTSGLSMLATPLHYGFDRYIAYFKNSSTNTIISRCVMYRTPCGHMIRNLSEMCLYLSLTKSKMTIDHFDFSSWVEPLAEYQVLKYVLFIDDLSEGKEFRPITCVNTINNKMPPPMEYMTTRQAMPGVNINVESDFLCGCDCTDNCQDKAKCACWQMTIQGQKILPNLYNDPNIGYQYRRLPERVLTGIYECNKTCKCSSSCLNRVVQQPLSQKLQLFMTEKKGWGVRCLNDIPQGSFICIYVGYLLTEADANEGGKNYGDEYLAELDYIEVVEKIKEDYESEVPPGSYLFPDSSNNTIDEGVTTSESSEEEYQERQVVSEISLRLRKRKKKPKPESKKKEKHTNKPSKVNARDMKNNPVPTKPMREYFGDNESVYIMDAKTSGNIGRYLNHSCSPNTYVQNVFVDTHDIRFPWVSFFALHYIKAGTELTWDYSYDVGSVPGKVMKCHCESVHCRGRLL